MSLFKNTQYNQLKQRAEVEPHLQRKCCLVLVLSCCCLYSEVYFLSDGRTNVMLVCCVLRHCPSHETTAFSIWD